MRVVAAPDKFRGTATAAEVAAAVGRAAATAGWDCDQVPVADGGEGTIDALGGANRTTTVRGPLGDPVEASWRLDRRTAVIEMATASPVWPSTTEARAKNAPCPPVRRTSIRQLP